MTLPITAFECPVDGCDWKVTTDEIARIQPAFRAKLTYAEDGPPIIDSSEYARESAQRIDGELRGHLETHDVFDWVRTVQRLKQDLYQQHGGIRPHSARANRSVFDTSDVEAYWHSRNSREG